VWARGRESVPYSPRTVALAGQRRVVISGKIFHHPSFADGDYAQTSALIQARPDPPSLHPASTRPAPALHPPSTLPAPSLNPASTLPPSTLPPSPLLQARGRRVATLNSTYHLGQACADAPARIGALSMRADFDPDSPLDGSAAWSECPCL